MIRGEIQAVSAAPLNFTHKLGAESAGDLGGCVFSVMECSLESC